MSYDNGNTFKGKIAPTYRDSVPHWPEERKTAKGAPNIVLVVLDDVGFSDIGCYGSEIHTPRMDALARGGLRYNNFHVTSMCSPTRACLISGRNAHSVGVGIIAEWSTGFPSYQGRITNRAATLPEILGDAGYGCYATGKWHLTNLKDYGAAGPHGDWPLGRGFSRWYGFHGALADQWHPELYIDNSPVKHTPGEGYHLSTDLTNQAIAHIRDHLTSAQDRPFFEYLAYGACHWPHHVPKDIIDRYRGRYDKGWDAIREERLARQKALGIVPPDTQLAPRNPDIPAWEDTPEDVRRASCILQETYAAFMEHTDQEIGRLVDYLASVGALDNTIFVVVSDNGASSEGGSMGAFNMRAQLTYHQGTAGDVIRRAGQVGGEHSYSHYPASWAQVSNTPLKWYKKNTHGGGVRSPMILHWPQGALADTGTVRSQFHHAIDLVPTFLDCASVDAPQVHKGVEQMPIHGSSLRYSFSAPQAPTNRPTQYFELIGNRAIYSKGWKAVALHRKGEDYERDAWELYHLEADFSETRDLAGEHPQKLRELVDTWWEEARRFDVLPLDDRQHERAEERISQKTRSRYDYQQGMARIDRLGMPDLTDRGFRISLALRGVTQSTQGVVISWGSRFAGFVLFFQDGRMRFQYNYTEDETHKLATAFPDGDLDVAIVFRKTGRRQGVLVLAIDGTPCAELRLQRTWPTYGTTAGLTCGDAGVPIADDYPLPFPFGAAIDKFVVELDEDGGTHPQEALESVLGEE